MSNPSWSRLIRFISATSSEPQYGEPIADDYADIGRLADEGKLKAKVIKVDRAGPLAGSATVTDEVLEVKALLGPLDIGDVPDVKCIGLNYKKHSGRAPPPYPSLFIKSSTAIAGYNSTTIIPKCAQDNEADYEAEMCIVIGADCKDVSPDSALDYVAGYTVGNDVSSRKWQRDPSRAGGVPQWCFSKGFDGFCPIGPCIVSKRVSGPVQFVQPSGAEAKTAQLIPDPATLDIKLSVNGELRQESPVGDLLFNTQAIVAFLSQGTTLRRGTVIMTGTPHGVGCVGPEEKWRALKDGDKVEVWLSEVGTLRHIIKYE